MIKITVSPQVLDALQAEYPIPLASASRALSKYITKLEKMVFQSLLRGQTPEQKKLNLFGLSLHDLANKGGQIGPNKIRLHKWLADNGLSLVVAVNQGSNLTGKSSDVKLTHLATITWVIAAHHGIESPVTASDLPAEKTSDYKAHCLSLFNQLYPDIHDLAGAGVLEAHFDTVSVDVKSLASYVVWLSNEATHIKKLKKDHALLQAQIILAITTALDGLYPQRRKPSAFGRMYYEGVSVQNVNKELRRAMLGNCWEYDIRSSVVAWKMGYAQCYLADTCPNETLSQKFSATLGYLNAKADFMATVRHYVFLADSHVSRELQHKLLKQAFTAISFGARANAVGWLDSAGQWSNPAIVDILKNTDERQRFLQDASVKSFIKEQGVLDGYLFNMVKAQRSDLAALAILKTPSGRLSKAKVMAYLYQHGETEVMEIVRQTALKHGKTPIANVHDAVFFKSRLGADLKDEVEHQMRTQTANPYWHLTASELKRYEPQYYDVQRQEQEHKKFIAQEELLAAGYKSHWTGYNDGDFTGAELTLA